MEITTTSDRGCMRKQVRRHTIAHMDGTECDKNLERILDYRNALSRKISRHREAAAHVSDAVSSVASIVGPEHLFAMHVSGTVILTRKWPQHPDNPNGRDVEIHPDRTMSLGPDCPSENDDTESYRRDLDIEVAAAWLQYDTRRTGDTRETTTDNFRKCTGPTQGHYEQGYLKAVNDALGELERLRYKPGAHIEHGISAIRRLNPHN